MSRRIKERTRTHVCARKNGQYSQSASQVSHVLGNEQRERRQAPRGSWRRRRRSRSSRTRPGASSQSPAAWPLSSGASAAYEEGKRRGKPRSVRTKERSKISEHARRRTPDLTSSSPSLSRCDWCWRLLLVLSLPSGTGIAADPGDDMARAGGCGATNPKHHFTSQCRSRKVESRKGGKKERVAAVCNSRSRVRGWCNRNMHTISNAPPSVSRPPFLFLSHAKTFRMWSIGQLLITLVRLVAQRRSQCLPPLLAV